MYINSLIQILKDTNDIILSQDMLNVHMEEGITLSAWTNVIVIRTFVA